MEKSAKFKLPAKPVIGWIENYVPEEIINAAGMHSYRVTGNCSGCTKGKSNSYLPSDFCSFSKSIIDSALDNKYSFLDGIIFTNSCTAMHKVYNIWKQYTDTPFVYLLEVPKIVTERSMLFFQKKISDMKIAIEKHFDTTIYNDSIINSINIYNESRTSLADLSGLRKEHNPKIKSSEFLNIIKMSSLMDRDEFNNLLKEKIKFFKNTKFETSELKNRIILMGNIVDDINISELIYECGGEVVYEDLCNSSRYFEESIREFSHPLKSLAVRYLGKYNSCSIDIKDYKLNKVKEKMKQYNADSIIMIITPFCASQIYDYSYMIKQLKNKNIPVLLIEGNEANKENLKTRISAFIESNHNE